jgi:hypothetical protein
VPIADSIFKVVREDHSSRADTKPREVQVMAQTQFASITYGYFSGANGSTINVSLERNMWTRLALNRMDGAWVKTIFRSIEK